MAMPAETCKTHLLLFADEGNVKAIQEFQERLKSKSVEINILKSTRLNWPSIPVSVIQELFRFCIACSMLDQGWIYLGTASCTWMCDSRAVTNDRSKLVFNIPVYKMVCVNVRIQEGRDSTQVLVDAEITMNCNKIFRMDDKTSEVPKKVVVLPKMTPASLVDKKNSRREIPEEVKSKEGLQKYWREQNGYNLPLDVFDKMVEVTFFNSRMTYPDRLVWREEWMPLRRITTKQADAIKLWIMQGISKILLLGKKLLVETSSNPKNANLENVKEKHHP